jgi:trigger factor
LADKSEVPLPEILVKDQVEMVERDLRQNLSYRGLTLEDYLESQNFSGRDDWLQKEVRPVAEERVKAGLVLSELSSKEKITVTKEEIASRKELYRQQYGRTPMNDQLDSEEAERDIANRLLTEKTVNRLAELNSKSAE